LDRIYATSGYTNGNSNSSYFAPILSFKDIRKSDAGEYVNVIVDEKTNKTIFTYYYIFYVIEKVFKELPKNYRAKFGQSQTLECEAKFSSEANDYNIQWQNSNRYIINNSSRYLVEDIIKENKVITNLLTINNVTEKDLGEYRCEANIYVGPITIRDYFSIYLNSSIMTHPQYLLFLFTMIFNFQLSSLIQ
jgi:hypothetical protein